MSATFASAIQEKFAGEMSVAEARLAEDLRHSFRRTLAGEQSFRSESISLSLMVDALRRFQYDVDIAVASGKFGPTVDLPAVPGTPTPLSADEEQFLRDADGLVDWVTRNHVSFHTILSILGHDLGELSRHDFDLVRTLANGVRPRVSGWAERNAYPVGESEDQG